LAAAGVTVFLAAGLPAAVFFDGRLGYRLACRALGGRGNRLGDRRLLGNDLLGDGLLGHYRLGSRLLGDSLLDGLGGRLAGRLFNGCRPGRRLFGCRLANRLGSRLLGNGLGRQLLYNRLGGFLGGLDGLLCSFFSSHETLFLGFPGARESGPL
jgi:hypothetical protein